MSVEIKYVVVRKGEEKMTFASKKEADAYDRMLDMAEVFSDWLCVAPLAIDEEQREALGLFLAENKDALQHILRTSRPPEFLEHSAGEGQDDTETALSVSAEEDDAEDKAEDIAENELNTLSPGKKTRAKKAA